jgi:hypothetical protein
LIALSRKYQMLGELRRSQYLVSRLEARPSLQRVASEFPGALRELDILPLEEIDRRAEALLAASRSGQTERWMEWLQEYHVTLRAALSVKRRLAGRRSIGEEDARRLALSLHDEDGRNWDAEFVLSVLRPPEGRINRVVFRRLESSFGETQLVITQTLFPERGQRW